MEYEPCWLETRIDASPYRTVQCTLSLIQDVFLVSHPAEVETGLCRRPLPFYVYKLSFSVHLTKYIYINKKVCLFGFQISIFLFELFCTKNREN